MKKRLESELISIAHRILKLKNKSEVDQLYKETQKLYETLSVLKFYQDNFESVKSEVTEDALEEKLEQSLEVEEAPAPVVEFKEEIVEPIVEAAPEVVSETEEELETETEEEVIVSEAPEATIEEEEVLAEDEPEAEAEEPVVVPEPSFKPIFELEVEEEDPSDSELAEQIEPAETASEAKPEDKPVALEDFLGDYKDPVFVKPNEVSLFGTETTESENVKETKEEAPKATTLNEAHSKSIAIGLNDRIGFVQHLFNDSNEDFNRVISQLNTFDTFEEAKNFINEMVIPDYNYWVGEEDYIERFMAIVEKKFQ